MDLKKRAEHHFGKHKMAMRVGEAVEVLQDIVTSLGAKKCVLWSHQETGNLWTYNRDKRIRRWCRDRGIPWQEARQFGVVRQLQSRDTWSKQHKEFMGITTYREMPEIASNRFVETVQSQPWPMSDQESPQYNPQGAAMLAEWWSA